MAPGSGVDSCLSVQGIYMFSLCLVGYLSRSKDMHVWLTAVLELSVKGVDQCVSVSTVCVFPDIGVKRLQAL